MNCSTLGFGSSEVCSSLSAFLNIMPLKITPSKKPLPIGKRSSLRNRSDEVQPASGRKVYPSRDFVAPVRPPPLTDEEVAALQTSNQFSRSILRYDPAQSLFEVAPDISGAANLLVLSDPSHSPPEIARHQSSDNQLSSQLTTSRRSASTSRNVILAPVRDDVCRDVLINSPPASAVCTSILIDATSVPVSAVTSSVSAVDTNSSVELPTSVVV